MTSFGGLTSRNFLQDVYPRPDIEQRSILRPIQLGCGSSRISLGVNLRKSSAHLWGRLGCGKTILLADIIAGALECSDCLVWTVGDELARAFMRPYLAGRIQTSPIDYVATSAEELAHMARAGLAIAQARRSHYADLRYNAGTIETPVGDGGELNGPPHILIVVDDEWLFRRVEKTAEGREIDEAFEQIVNMTSAGAVSVVYSGVQRSTAPSWVMDLPTRIGMGITDQGEMQLAFGDGGKELVPLEYATRGSGHVHEAGSSYVSAFRGFYLTPREMDEVGQDTAPWRPRMDKVSKEAAADTYRSRWSRSPLQRA